MSVICIMRRSTILKSKLLGYPFFTMRHGDSFTCALEEMPNVCIAATAFNGLGTKKKVKVALYNSECRVRVKLPGERVKRWAKYRLNQSEAQDILVASAV